MRRIVLDYYFVLRFVLRDKPQVRRLRTRCRHCGIFFIADPHNPGRDDLGCPFGCADLHRRRRSNERSADYNRSPVGKLKRARREEERRLAKGRSAPEVAGWPEDRSVEVLEASLDTAETSVEAISPGLRNDHLHPPPAVIPPSSDPMSIDSEMATPDTSAHSRGAHREPGPRANDGSLPAEPQEEFAPGIVAYIRMVISLLEGRPVQQEEILEMLARAKRQRGFAREKRLDYVLRRLREEPEKPP